jgi:hypothetical protein
MNWLAEVDWVMVLSTAVALFLLGVVAGVAGVWSQGRRQAKREPVDKAAAFEARMVTWRRITKAAEGTLLDNIAATTPWLAPIIPASIAFHNLMTYLEFPFWLAFVSALCIEFLGLAAVHTVFQLWEWNQTKRASDQIAPVSMAIGVGVAYLVIILTVNAMLEVTGFDTWTWQNVTHVLAKMLLSLLAAVSAFVLAIRSQHARLVAGMERDKLERRENIELGKLRQAVPALKQQVQELQQQLKQVQQGRTAVEQAALAKVTELEQERDRALQAVTALQQQAKGHDTVATEVQRLEAVLQQQGAELLQLQQRWEALPPAVQAATQKKVGGGSYRQLADEFGINHTAVSRQYTVLYGANGTTKETT